MQFSIEVLPAPFGPMMARISLLRISKDTSVSAFTPPKPSDTFSTASSTSPLGRGGPSGALMGPSTGATCSLPPCGGEMERGVSALPSERSALAPPALPLPTRGRGGNVARVQRSSRRPLQRRRLDRIGLDVANLDSRGDDALAAVLERNLGGD